MQATTVLGVSRFIATAPARTLVWVLLSGLMLAACGESPSVEAKDAVFDQSVMHISEELGAPPQEATRTDGIEWVKLTWKNDAYSLLREGCFWTKHASWPHEGVNPTGLVDALSSIVKSETGWKTWDAEGFQWSDVNDSTTMMAALTVGSRQWFYFASTDQAIDVYVFRRC